MENKYILFYVTHDIIHLVRYCLDDIKRCEFNTIEEALAEGLLQEAEFDGLKFRICLKSEFNAILTLANSIGVAVGSKDE